MLRLFIIVILLSACGNANNKGRKELDSLLRSEDSVRMTTDISMPLINIKEIMITNDPNVDFARLMRYYYMAGLSGAEIEINKGRRKEVMAIAQDQIAHHKGDIEWLDEYLHEHPPVLVQPEFVAAFQQKLREGDMKKFSSQDFDIHFLELVVKHHTEALVLTDVYEKYSTDSKLLTRFRSIAKAHKPEIAKLEKLATELKE